MRRLGMNASLDLYVLLVTVKPQTRSLGHHFTLFTEKRSPGWPSFVLLERPRNFYVTCCVVLTPWVQLNNHLLSKNWSWNWCRIPIRITGCGEVSRRMESFYKGSSFLVSVNRWLSVRFNLLSSAVIGLTALVSVLSPQMTASLAGLTLAFAATFTNDVRSLFAIYILLIDERRV